MSVDILAGFAGRTSLGHGAIFGVSTYVVVYCHRPVPACSPASAFVLGVLAATAVAAVFALLAVRTSGVYFLLLTLALGMIIWGICLRWTQRDRRRERHARRRPPGDRCSVTVRSIGPCWPAQPSSSLCDVAVRALAVRADAARHPRQRKPDAQPRLQRAAASVHRLHGRRASSPASPARSMRCSTISSARRRWQLAQSVEGVLMTIVGGVGTLFGAFIGAAAIIAAGERRQLLYRALADGARHHVRSDHDLRPRGHHRQAARHPVAQGAT